MFDVFDSLLVGQEVEYDGKIYLRLTTIKDGLITAVEKGAELPAPVVVIKEPRATKPKGDSNTYIVLPAGAGGGKRSDKGRRKHRE